MLSIKHRQKHAMLQENIKIQHPLHLSGNLEIQCLLCLASLQHITPSVCLENPSLCKSFHLLASVSVFASFTSCLALFPSHYVCLSLLTTSFFLVAENEQESPVSRSGCPSALCSVPGQTQPKVIACRTLLRRWGTPAWTHTHTHVSTQHQLFPIKRSEPVQ